MARLRFLGIVRDWMRCGSLETPAGTLREVLRAMREKGGWRLEGEAFRNGNQPIPEMEFLVNGVNIRFLRGLDTALAPDEEVVVFLHRSWAEVPFL